jgi:hypothetical protein
LICGCSLKPVPLMSATSGHVHNLQNSSRIQNAISIFGDDALMQSRRNGTIKNPISSLQEFKSRFEFSGTDALIQFTLSGLQESSF